MEGLDLDEWISRNCQCGNPHFDMTIEQIVIERSALKEAVLFLKTKNYQKIAIVADRNTYEVAGRSFLQAVKQLEILTETSLVGYENDSEVLADEKSIVQVMTSVSANTEIIIAIGAGTIHDIVRFVSYKMGKPFLSIPTAPSVDGFTSMGAPIIVNGNKKTYQTQAPIAVFADLDILMAAPKKMIAAGFGDMLGKTTSLVDWQFGHLIDEEPFCPLVFQMTEQALEKCSKNFQKIANREEGGIKILMQSLILSGLAMLRFGQSHPASGAEHHLSHYWEMVFIKEKKKQVLHGEKVSISTCLISEFYQTTIKAALIELKKDSILFNDKRMERLKINHGKILGILTKMPTSIQMQEMVRRLGGELNPQSLGISEELIESSLQKAHLLRERFTFLSFYNQFIRK
ncbi:sn-glycerol-1-phosphate dehydrogenase [Alkalihalobacillus sp. 1P02AB]|uniref:sn-glycerol-1-phosphate dehydrogenase n=1 Tax=Alkalihalobacillus sp. 1P02AB TaxID=3132260 RepID=UPI0039A46C24